MGALQVQPHLVSTLLGFHTLKLKKKIQTRSCRHKALSCRPLGFTIEKDLQAKPVNLPRCAAPWRRVLNPRGVESAKQSPRGSSAWKTFKKSIKYFKTRNVGRKIRGGEPRGTFPKTLCFWRLHLVLRISEISCLTKSHFSSFQTGTKAFRM